jgi:disulfide bond formation protein DsbB
MTVISSGSRPHLSYAIVATIGMAIVILAALGFQHIGGYIPCELCLKERWPYYIGIPVAVLAAISSALRLPPIVTRLLLGLAAIIMLVGAGMSVYHAGVEWKFWEGPTSCSTSIDSIARKSTDLLSDLSTQHGPSCTDAALRVLGLSLAGWNVIVSVILALIAHRGARRAG